MKPASFQSIAPGKLILSGEHSVVYGKPAIAMAINGFVKTTIHFHDIEEIVFDLPHFREKTSTTLHVLKTTQKRLANQYQAFLKGNCLIQEILKSPLEFVQFAVAQALDSVKVQLPAGFTMSIRSTIPIGCGMGSSAAAALSVSHAIVNAFGALLNQHDYFQMGCEVEKLQHGYTSGLDVYTSLHGGCVYFQSGHIESRSMPTFLSLFLVDTGKPITLTGECVSQVARRFKHSDHLWEDFATITKAMDKALTAQHFLESQRIIRENHRLLVQIGVVPPKVQHFIQDIERIHGAGKICGAGAIAGDASGIVMVLSESKAEVVGLCEKYHFSLLNFQGEERGLRAL